MMIEKIEKYIIYSSEDKAFQIIRRQIGGGYYDREGKKRFLHRV
jgi:hypothetical protein